jgi:Ricin-type beta-trefoil lectin domain
MRKSRRLIVPLAAFALVAGAGLGLALTQVANAQVEIATCGPTVSGSDPNECTITQGSAAATTVHDPVAILAVVTLKSGDSATKADQYAVITYSVTCTLDGESTTTENTGDDDYAFASDTAGASVTDELALGYTNPDTCTINSAEAQLETLSSGGTLSASSSGSITMELEWDPATSATTSSASSSSVDVAYISGYGGKCLDDRGNSSSNGAQVIIWGCNHGDSAQSWSWSGYELKHDGKCVNDPGYGGSGTKVILYSCNGGSNEKWSHVSGGVFKLFYASKGALCLDDPAYSKTNGTRLTVYTCNNGGNQHWSRS